MTSHSNQSEVVASESLYIQIYTTSTSVDYFLKSASYYFEEYFVKLLREYLWEYFLKYLPNTFAGMLSLPFHCDVVYRDQADRDFYTLMLINRTFNIVFFVIIAVSKVNRFCHDSSTNRYNLLSR